MIEDDEDKRNRISDFIATIITAEIKEARSLQSGLQAIIAETHDVVILDMTMPTFDITSEEGGGRPQAYAGRELLRHMKRRNINTPAIVVTQFDRFGQGPNSLTLEELNKDLHASHPGHYLGTVYYSVTLDGWQDALSRLLSKVTTKKGPTQ
ncbi:response regulator transcription factor [Corallococcus exiguus]|uniref:Response regulator n=1 Tax=Corallococcus exiguus TaxID=83462 RepID=A0A7X5BQS8_9BACT|nr:response regulator [Corallococcus exiguus]NBC40019.1 response regulator [Corallococcus exiguus]